MLLKVMLTHVEPLWAKIYETSTRCYLSNYNTPIFFIFFLNLLRVWALLPVSDAKYAGNIITVTYVHGECEPT